jgi:hypothetical protein
VIRTTAIQHVVGKLFGVFQTPVRVVSEEVGQESGLAPSKSNILDAAALLVAQVLEEIFGVAEDEQARFGVDGFAYVESANEAYGGQLLFRLIVLCHTCKSLMVKPYRFGAVTVATEAVTVMVERIYDVVGDDVLVYLIAYISGQT